jgi:hypothetical protein
LNRILEYSGLFIGNNKIIIIITDASSHSAPPMVCHHHTQARCHRIREQI